MAQPLDEPPQTIDRLLGFGKADAPALIDRHGPLTFSNARTLVAALAENLYARGLKPGDRVASWLGKTRLACLMPLAAARAGLIHVPINPLLKRAQVAHITQDSGARLLIAGPARLESLESSDLPADCRAEEEGALNALIADGMTSHAFYDELGVMTSSADKPLEACAILYTSGSTGRPKGVVLSHANLWLGAIAVRRYLRLDARHRSLCVLPLSFDYGQNQLLATWAAGACAVPGDYLVARDVIRAVERYEISVLAGVPPLWTQLAAIDWPAPVAARLEVITNSGGRLPIPLVRRLRELFPEAALHSMYGLTEAFRSTSLDPALIDQNPDAIGTAIPYAEIMVVRADGSLAEDDEPGELVHAGPLVAQGYWRDPDRTAQRFRPAPAASCCGGTAVWSGDTVIRGHDGLLRFVGRDDEMIKSMGNRISPTEIEEAAIASGHVREAVAWGIEDPDLGQVIALAISGSPEEEAELRTFLKRELPNFMQPQALHWYEELPRTANGKLDRAGLAKGHRT